MRVECLGHINLKALWFTRERVIFFWKAPHTHSIRQKWSSSAQIPALHHWPQSLMILQSDSLVYRRALASLHSMIPPDRSCSICACSNPYSFSTVRVCSPIKGSRVRQASAGERDRKGAGRGLISPWESLKNDPLALLWGWESTSSSDSTGVTQASVPSKIRPHSACVLVANTWVNVCLSCGQSDTLICEGRSASSKPKPVVKEN